MKITHLIILLVRFFAICLVVYSINSFTYNFIILSGANDIAILTYIIPGAIMLAGVLVWLMPYSLARSITGFKGNFDSETSSISSDQFLNTAFLILVLYLIYRIVSDGSYWLYYYFNYEKYGLNDIGIDAKASLFATGLEAILVIMILAGRQRIFDIFKKLRS